MNTTIIFIYYNTVVTVKGSQVDEFERNVKVNAKNLSMFFGSLSILFPRGGSIVFL